MKFDFFKKKGSGQGKRADELFDPTEDELNFDELEDTGEFLSDEQYTAPPSDPTYPQTPAPPVSPPSLSRVPPSRLPPLPPAHAAPRPTLPKATPLAKATPLTKATPLPKAPPVSRSPAGKPAPAGFDDLTMINQPALAPIPGPAPVPASPPAMPTAPVPPGPPPRQVPLRPAPPSVPPRPQVPYAGDDDKTVIMRAPVGEESVVAWLVLVSTPGRGRDYRLPGGMVRLGLDPSCDICVDFDTYISSRHAEISFSDGQYQIRDLDSTNGTFVNEARISEAVLHDHDRVRLGQTTFVFMSLNL